jgi:hypothetical protein
LPINPNSSPNTAKDEVGVALGQEIEVRLRAVQPSLADEPAGPERDRRLRRVVAGAQRIAVGSMNVRIRSR